MNFKIECFILFLIMANFSFCQNENLVLFQLEKNVNEAINDSLKVKHLLKLGSYQKSRDYHKLPLYHLEIENIFRKNSYNKTKHEILKFNQSGVYNRRVEDFSGALENYLIAQRLMIAAGDSLNLAINYGNIAILYKHQKECEKAIITFKKAIKLHEKFKNYKKLGSNYSSVARCYDDIHKTDSAFYAFDQATYYAELSKSKEIIYRVLGNKAFLLSEKGRYKEALPIQLSYLKYANNIDKKTSIIAIHTNLAKTYLGLKEFDKALIHANEAIEIGTKEGLTNRIDKAFLHRSNIYQLLKKYDLALKDVLSYNKINEEVNKVNSVKKLREIELKNEYAKKRLTDSILHQEEKSRIIAQARNQRLEKQLYMAILLVVILFGSVVIYYAYQFYLQTKRSNLQKELNLSKKISLLNTKVTSKKEEAKELLTETLIQLKGREKLVENLSKLTEKKENISLQSIIADLKADKLEDSKVVLLKKNIETLNYNFIKEFKREHPSLTKTDMEICSFIKIGLSRIEIANLRKTSIQAIKSSRFRLKKKLHLSQNDSLDVYIRNF